MAGAADSPAAAVVLDAAALAELRRLERPDRPGQTARVLNLYLNNAALLCERAAAARIAGDAEALHRALHNLRSTSESVGALALAQLLRPWETQARLGQTQIPEAAQAALDDCYQASCAALRALL